MGRCARNPLTRKRQVGAVCPGSQDEPVNRDRDSSLWIAYSLRDVRWLVPGSPANYQLGCRGVGFKRACRFFNVIRKGFQPFGEPLLFRHVAKHIVLVACSFAHLFELRF